MNAPDLREQLIGAQQWVNGLVRHVTPDQLSLPTPCSDFDVASLLGHLHAVRLRTLRYATDRSVGGLPSMVALDRPLPDQAALLAELTDQTRRAWDTWSTSDLGSLQVEGPFGTVPGGVAVGIMAAEDLVHGWDLAVATGQDAEADPAVASVLLGFMRGALPPAGGRDEMPFADPVTPAGDAGPTARLAHWTGRAVPTT